MLAAEAVMLEKLNNYLTLLIFHFLNILPSTLLCHMNNDNLTSKISIREEEAIA